METYGMAAPYNDNAIDCYHQYVAQTGYRCEQPEDGDHLRAYAAPDMYERPQHSWYPPRLRAYQDPRDTYTEARDPSPMRNIFNNNRYNSRNGLYAPESLCGGGGDSYIDNSRTLYNPYVPFSKATHHHPTGLGNYDRNAWQRQGRSRNRWF